MTIHPRRGEVGFSLLELVIVMALVAILMAALGSKMLGARAQQRIQAMKTVGQTVEAALGFYVRDYPATRLAGDPLLSRGGTGAPWRGNSDAPAVGLFSPTGDPYLKQWPSNPYGTGNVVITRVATCPRTGAPGQVFVCRAGDTDSFRVVAIAQDRGGASVVAHDITMRS